MKSKKMVYVLGGLVTLVWGLIIYRVFAAVYHNDDKIPLPVTTSTFKEPYDDHSLKPDTSKLTMSYRNPFSNEAKKDTTTVKVRADVKITKPVLPPAINWGFIKYSGFVRNPSSKKLVALVTINGRNTMLQEGETQDKVKLIKNMQDSIRISYNGTTKFIKLDNSTP
ncbi:hypothetical protein HQ865_15260 [Mucilaginibacter mali]|uniref:Type II secretion system protein GspC N-terminal domain-containing protein n=1 Tax=Mucilaginibacter mali TaxID=2740462 RepID=A0A7D4TPY2_9SPHI|nr:hypothetical protein [Mucilaginibacter mali]QKJ31054.1 hypothetical protein HQ865_15260 [Mucilaginibacter mali]